MTERPILFSGPMVRAILAGTKTQTRRIAKDGVLADIPLKRRWCPYGAPGDRLWVRETFTVVESGTSTPGGQPYDPVVLYAADDHAIAYELRCRPSIHMPRKLCRLVLEVTGVRVERLQDISERDAKAEGVEPALAGHESGPGWGASIASRPIKTHRTGFVRLWNSLNEERGFGWAVNPYVWVVSFRRAAAQEAA